VNGLIVLGSSIMLGWPQRTSLLGDNDAQVPDYVAEWEGVLENIFVPVSIISGAEDEVAGDEFLQRMVDENPMITLTVLPDASHSLINIKTKEVCAEECAVEVRKMVARKD
jgi:pimeloyl-ACP methyl ester carboxylesterase